MLELRALSALPEDSRLPKGPQKSLSCESTFPCEEYLSDADSDGTPALKRKGLNLSVSR